MPSLSCCIQFGSALHPIQATRPGYYSAGRYGKFLMLQFDVSGQLSGAHIKTYLLEKTRVVSQGCNRASLMPHSLHAALHSLHAAREHNYSCACACHFNMLLQSSVPPLVPGGFLPCVVHSPTMVLASRIGAGP